MVQGSQRRGHVAPSQVGSQLEVEITKMRGWGSPRPKILLLFWGRVTPSGGSSLLPGLPACPAALSVLQDGFPVPPTPCPRPSPHPVCAPAHKPARRQLGQKHRGGCSLGSPPFTTQPRPSLLLVKAFFFVCPSLSLFLCICGPVSSPRPGRCPEAGAFSR